MSESMSESASCYEDTESELNDTHTHILDLRDKFYERIKPKPKKDGYGGMELPYPFVLEAQLSQMAEDKLEMQSDIEFLIRKNVIRSFEIELADYPRERFFVVEIDYVTKMKEMKSDVIDKFLENVALTHRSPRITREALIKAGMTEEEISKLIKLNCLLMKNSEIFFMSIPTFGGARSSITHGRRFLVNYVRSKQGRVCDRSEVERRTIDDSIFYAEFHAQELIGIGVFDVIETKGKPDKLRLVFDPYKR